MTENIFIEPSTGRSWTLHDKNYPYLKCSQIFSHKNNWINLKPDLPISELNFADMNNGEKNDWEYCMLDTVKFPSLQQENEEDDISEHEHNQEGINPKLLEVQKVIKEISHLIDMPLP